MSEDRREQNPDALEDYWRSLVSKSGGHEGQLDSIDPSAIGFEESTFGDQGLGDLLEDLNDARLLMQDDSTKNGQVSATPRIANPPQLELVAGARISGYELLREIGRGGMGIVFAARQIELDRVVALKLIRTGPLATVEDRARFQAEANATASMTHTGIVSVFDAGACDGFHYFSMELIEGPTLAERLVDGPIEPRVAAEYARKISDAVQHAHEHGVLHRDLKPSNVIIDRDGGWPRITDFGLAKFLSTDSTTIHDWTMSGAMVGTPSYMSPEQALGESKRVSEASDVYSIGSMFYEMLTGRAPFRAASSVETMRQVVDAEPVAPTALNAGISRDLETICLKCLAKHPALRYTTAGALTEELERYLAGQPILSRPISAVTKATRWCGKNRWLATTSALLLASLVLGTIVSTAMWRQSNRNAAQLEKSQSRMRSAVHSLHAQLFDDESLYWNMSSSFRRKMLADVMSYLGEFAQQPNLTASERLQLAQDYLAVARTGLQVSRDRDCERAARKALDIARQVCSSQPSNVAGWQIRYDATEQVAKCLLAVQEDNPKTRDEVASLGEESVAAAERVVELARVVDQTAIIERTTREDDSDVERISQEQSQLVAARMRLLARGLSDVDPKLRRSQLDALDELIQVHVDGQVATRRVVRAAHVEALTHSIQEDSPVAERIATLEKVCDSVGHLREADRAAKRPLGPTALMRGIYRQRIAALYDSLGESEQSLKNQYTAAGSFVAASQASPGNRLYQGELAIAMAINATYLARNDDFEAAKNEMQDAAKAWSNLVKTNANDQTARRSFLQCAARTHEYALEVDDKETAIMMLRYLAGDSILWFGDYPDDIWAYVSRLWSMGKAIELCREIGQVELAEQLLDSIKKQHELRFESRPELAIKESWEKFINTEPQTQPSQLDLPPLKEWRESLLSDQ